MAKYRANFRRDGASGERRNSLGLDTLKLNQLFDILDARTEGKPNLKRTHVRWPFRHDSLVFRLVEAYGGRREFKVAARNLSNSGLSVMHNSYVHPGTECEIELPTNNSTGSVTVQGLVQRCQHIRGTVHEVGLLFHSQIDARMFLTLDDMPAYYSKEMIDPDKMEGSVLHIDDSPLDRRLFAHYLADTRIIIKSADTIEDARVKAKDSYDVIVMDYMLSDGNGLELLNWMRDNGILTPVIMLTADSSSETRKKLGDAEIDGLLNKPVEKGTLLRTITEFLSVGEDSRSSDVDGSMGDLTSAFLGELNSMIDDLRACMEKDDAMTAHSIALRLKGTAPALGFDRLAVVSDRASAALAGSMSCEESHRQLDALLDACERVKHRRAG